VDPKYATMGVRRVPTDDRIMMLKEALKEVLGVQSSENETFVDTANSSRLLDGRCNASFR
jgi:hypothetical protein